jgi:hypothetical protein
MLAGEVSGADELGGQTLAEISLTRSTASKRSLEPADLGLGETLIGEIL